MGVPTALTTHGTGNNSQSRVLSVGRGHAYGGTQVQEAPVPAELHPGEPGCGRPAGDALRQLRQLLQQHQRLLCLWQTDVRAGGLHGLPDRYRGAVVPGHPGLRAVRRGLQTPGRLSVPAPARHQRLCLHVELVAALDNSTAHGLEQLRARRSENLLRAQLVHRWQQQQQLHLGLVCHLLRDAPQPDSLLLHQPADDSASSCGTAAGIGHDTAGGAGGDAHGDHDGDGLSHLLATLHHVCPGGGHQQRHRHPASSRIPALLLLQDRHGLQSNHLRLHEQTVSELPAENGVLRSPSLEDGKNHPSCPRPPCSHRCRRAAE
ncbi:uncharacterized protein LOC126039116 isoform X2 [Accipiter gentilis]|uniref:uncharacterized protein LOC126039116 isoform X2 n=1 Tax=Astur gentilis TaxID=8957 RepID=UPI00210FC9F7|nr:uncharacterized protein LOC126039116 isoform X2 [Accipiter gentilis]XP_049657675.1 uncharacterized protein LOC126039116 isoform X2 [Accipiter gentilis]